MTAPNRSTLWGEVLVDELIAAGVTGVCLAPGSRSTPMTVAFAQHEDIDVFSHLDERSAAFFALGRSRRCGEPTALVCTSGTAAANFHPAVIEAHQSRVPLVVLTADRPPELRDSGANQTIDQEQLYGSAVRDYRTLPEPGTSARKLRSLRVAADRAVDAALGTPPGPVHLNVPVAKPLEPTEDPGSVPDDLDRQAPLGVPGRDGPFVTTTSGRPTLDDGDLSSVVDAIADADRGLIVTGPTNRPTPSRPALAELATATGFPVLADPLSGHRFGHGPDVPVCGGFDSYLDAAADWPDPEVVLRFGASPTSKVCRHYLRDTAARQFVVDPAGGWREAEFTVTDLLEADPTWLAESVADGCSPAGDDTDAWADRFRQAEATHWETVGPVTGSELFEGSVLATVAREAPDPATILVSNSMPVRDFDRFGEPRSADLSTVGNRGASGIDGLTSTALGAGSATEDPLVAVLGDLAFYHDTNGLLAIDRCGVDATIVLLNNDGGGIFHMLPIEEFDPPFTDFFRTPHGLEFEPVSDLYDLEYALVDDLDGFATAYRESVGAAGTQLIEVRVDAEDSHRTREQLHERVCERVE